MGVSNAVGNGSGTPLAAQSRDGIPLTSRSGRESLTDLAFGALIIAAAAWTLGNTGIARRARSLATLIFIFFLAIAAILFAFAVLGVSLR